MSWSGLRIGLLLPALIVAVFVPGVSEAQRDVDLELIMAIDVSGSVDSEEYALRMGGSPTRFGTRTFKARSR